MKHFIILAALIGGIWNGPLAPGTLPGTGPVDTATVARFAGEWQGQATATATVEQAVKQVTDSMSVLTRGIARGRLLKANAAPARIRMQQDGGALRIQFEDRPAVTLPLSGSSVKDGERTMRLEPEGETGAALRQIGETDQGRRVNVYRLGPGADAMTMAVTVTSPRLPSPLTYTLSFTRAASGGAAPGAYDFR
jgi:hypothetical protein